MTYNFLKHSTIVIIMLTAFVVEAIASVKNKTITLGVTKTTLQSSQGQLSQKVYLEIFEGLDLQLKIVVVPAIRLAQQVKSGTIDGELIRMSSYAKKHPYLTRIDEPTFSFVLAAYSAGTKIKINDWKSLSPYTVGHRLGIKVIKNELVKVLPKEQILSSNNFKETMNLLSLKRIHIYIGVEFLTDELLKKNHPQNNFKIFKTKRLKRDSAHIFLNKKFSYLAPKISKKLKAMKLSGRYKKIRKSLGK